MGNIELTLLDAPESVRFSLEEAEIATRRGAEVVSELAAFTRAPRRPHQAPVDPKALLDHLVDRCRQSFDPRITLRRDAVEENRLAAPLIRLSLRQVRATELNQAPGPGRCAQAQVADNGAGMDKATRERLFEPFFITKEVGKGTGLGLATAYGIVRDYHGWIECQSAPGAGACFWVFLPLGDPHAELEPAAPGGQTLLLIEDESVVRETVARLRGRAGYRVCEAADGVEGLELFGQLGGQVDLLNLGLAMPRLSREEVLERLAALAPRLKVVLFTGYGEG